MKTDSIHDRVKAYYETQQLPPETVESLKSILLAARRPTVSAPRPTLRQRLANMINFRRPRLVLAMAMAFAVMVVMNLGVLYFWHGSSQFRITNSIAHEIAMNHVKNLKSEFQASSFEALQGMMPNLDFEPVSSKIMNHPGLVLQGARYCSIQGYLAVQIIFLDASGQRHSLYQAPSLPPLQKIQRVEINIDNIKITMWNESGVFMGLAGSLNPSPDIGNNSQL